VLPRDTECTLHRPSAARQLHKTRSEHVSDDYRTTDWFVMSNAATFIRLTVRQSRRNKAGLKSLYVRSTTKSFFDFNEIWHVGRGR